MSRKLKGRFAGPVPNRNLFADDKEDFRKFEPFPGRFGSGPRAFPPGEQLQVTNINMCKEVNEPNHNTSEYMTKQLVVRRGQQFVVEVTFSRPVTPQDDFQMEFLIGSDAVVNKGSHVVVTFGSRPGGPWAGQILGTQGTVVTLGITPSAKAIFGLYRTYIGVSMGDGIERTEKDLSTNMYLLFNPWCPDDDVYYPDDAGRWEYVMNATGTIYQGSVDAVAERSWVFGQFDEGILDACIYILDVCQMAIYNRNEVIKIVRTASAAINSQDDNGVLVGNWSDDYSMGTPPTSWTGSARILQQFYASGNPVCYAQCWVFAGCMISMLSMSTVLRCLGIPTRVITNFNSAHDNTANLKTELIFKPDGSPDRRNTRDSIWNYHCWCESFLRRIDLPPKYNGWQVVDATPQETSDGYYRCGPSSINAIKDGELCHPFDCRFVFAEVNSDIIYLKRDKYGNLTPYKVDKTSVGSLIATKAIGAWTLQDITHEYKYPEGSPENDRTMATAEGYGCERDHSELPDTTLSVKIMAEPCPLGGIVRVMVTFNNQAKSTKLYQHTSVVIEIPPQEYMKYLGSQQSLHIVVNAQTDTEQVSDVELIHPAASKFSITISGYKQVDRETFATVSFKNPFNIPIQNAKLCIEGAGLLNYRVFPYTTIAPFAEIVQKVVFIPRTPGRKTIVAVLDSDNLTDMHGLAEFDVSA
ncbi:coagulation factor XIII A chain-like [Melanotaenia boesemani]|uniref:coagulation factor XIII A chain-like n=1 Tax=Melanotaenia boesemani TaxID=1250792 RepID=UPI001C05E3B5|nr:coagulation factor XIII A chain-like [Melanotaenia boesemani]